MITQREYYFSVILVVAITAAGMVRADGFTRPKMRPEVTPPPQILECPWWSDRPGESYFGTNPDDCFLNDRKKEPRETDCTMLWKPGAVYARNKKECA